MTQAAHVKPVAETPHSEEKVAKPMFHEAVGMPLRPLVLRPLQSTKTQQRSDDAHNMMEEQTYEDGVRDGKAEALVQYQKTVDVMEQALEALKNDYKAMAVQIEKSHLHAILQCLQTLMPPLMDAAFKQEVENMIRMGCAQSVYGPVSLCMSDETSEILGPWLAPHADQIKVEISPELTPGQLQLRWDGGGADFNPDEVRQQCVGLLKGILDEMNEESHD